MNSQRGAQWSPLGDAREHSWNWRRVKKNKAFILFPVHIIPRGHKTIEERNIPYRITTIKCSKDYRIGMIIILNISIRRQSNLKRIKCLNKLLHQKWYEMVQQAYEKMLKSLVIRKMQIKTTVTTAHALEWLKFKKKKANGTKERWGCATSRWWKCEIAPPLWKTVTVSYVQDRIILTNYQRIENLRSHKNLYGDVRSSYIHGSSKLDTTQMSINR